MEAGLNLLRVRCRGAVWGSHLEPIFGTSHPSHPRKRQERRAKREGGWEEEEKVEKREKQTKRELKGPSASRTPRHRTPHPEHYQAGPKKTKMRRVRETEK